MFDESSTIITEIAPPVVRGGQVYLSWQTSCPPGTWFQCYINQQLAFSTQALSEWVAIPSGPVHFDLGALLSEFGDDGFGDWGFGSAAGMEGTDWSSTLPPAVKQRAELSWTGGTFEGTDLAGFHVYGPDVAGGPVDYTLVLANIPAYPGDIVLDGFGLGAYGSGGFGQSGGNYEWDSDPLKNGTYQFAVRPYDAAGNEGSAQTASVTILAPPGEPAVGSDGVTRLTYTLIAGPRAVLTWNPSPG